MDNKTKQKIKKWEEATEELKECFIEKYYKEAMPVDTYWISDTIGDILFINDNFYNLSDLLDFLKYDYTEKQMFAYYDERLRAYEKEQTCANIKNWKMMIKEHL